MEPMDRGIVALVGNGPGLGELFQLFRDHKPKTRGQLATLTGLARSTIASRMESLVELGLVAGVGDAHSTGGRPPSQFALAPAPRLVAGVDLGARHATVGIADLTGCVLATTTTSIDIADEPASVLDTVLELAEVLMDSLSRDKSDLLSIGIGVPGPVEHSTGKPSTPPIMPGWDGFDIPGYVQQKLDVPVLVDNDVNLMALGERSVAWPHIDDLMFVKIATGIGSGIVSGGLLQRGAQGTAGDLGHVPVEHERSVSCRCGNSGCLEAVAAGPAVVSALRSSGFDVSSVADVVARVKEGDVEAIRVVREAGRKIGEVLAICVSLINPSVIVIGGSMSQAGDHLIAGVRETVYARSMPLASSQLAIVPSRAAEQAGVIGAAKLALEHALAPGSVNAMHATMARTA